jgi:prepilin-type N-terminal cleavage/methylation domain-containing protein
MSVRHTADATKFPGSESGAGFTLIELLVAISILLFLSMAMLFSYNSMNARLTLDNLAHQTAQWVRATQVTAMSVRHTADATKFPGYGLHFDRGTPSRFVFFADLNGDHRYAPLLAGEKCGDIGVECQKEISLLKGNTIVRLCGESVATLPAGDCPALGAVGDGDIVFTRPDPDAVISGDDMVPSPVALSRLRVTLSSVQNYQRTVEIWTTGQVSVQ